MLEKLIVIRGIERIIIQCGGLLLVVLGILLFKWGITEKSSLTIKRKGFKFQLLNATPGVLLALFGTVVFIIGINGRLVIQGDLNSLKDFQSTSRQHQKKDKGPGISIFYSNEQRDLLQNFRLYLKDIPLVGRSADELKEEIFNIRGHYDKLLENLKAITAGSTETDGSE